MVRVNSWGARRLVTRQWWEFGLMTNECTMTKASDTSDNRGVFRLKILFLAESKPFGFDLATLNPIHIWWRTIKRINARFVQYLKKIFSVRLVGRCHNSVSVPILFGNIWHHGNWLECHTFSWRQRQSQSQPSIQSSLAQDLISHNNKVIAAILTYIFLPIHTVPLTYFLPSTPLDDCGNDERQSEKNVDLPPSIRTFLKGKQSETTEHSVRAWHMRQLCVHIFAEICFKTHRIIQFKLPSKVVRFNLQSAYITATR